MTWMTARGFARHMLQDDRLPLRPLFDSIAIYGAVAMESILYREECWQVELITIFPGAEIPQHRHRRVESVDLLLAGRGGGLINGIPIKKPRAASLAANLVSVPKDQWHGGHSGSSGVVYLSFQKWDGEPGLISEDWEAWSPAQT